MTKCFIPNRTGKRISVLVEEAPNQRGLVFVMHGLGGFKEQEQIIRFAESFKGKGFTAVRFDTRNTLGESEGTYEEASITSYYQDLEDVIQWASTQSWYQEPFVLCGHSLGGVCTALFAEAHPEKVLGLAPISPLVSGALSVEAHHRYDKEAFKAWERTGWKEEVSNSKPSVIKRLPWSHIADRLKYDLLPNAHNLTMPVLLIVGERDTSTPPDHVRILYEALPGKKELHVLPDAPHTFRGAPQLAEIQSLFEHWIDGLACSYRDALRIQ